MLCYVATKMALDNEDADVPGTYLVGPIVRQNVRINDDDRNIILIYAQSMHLLK